MFNRWIEDSLLDTLSEEGIGTIAFMPLAQGILTNKYLNGIPENSRAANYSIYLHENDITEEKINKVRLLNDLAKERGQSLAQMAIAWVLKDKRITSALIGASKANQIEENVAALNNTNFSDEELTRINRILSN